MKFSACGVEDMPHPDDGTSIRVAIFANENLKQQIRHVHIPLILSWEEMIDQVFDGILPQQLSYFDEECDMIRLGSASEWGEAVKVAQLKNYLPLVVQPPTQSKDKKHVSPEYDSDSSASDFIKIEVKKPKIFRTNSTDDEEDGFINMPDKTVTSLANEDGDSSVTPPLWFSVYMKKFKQDIKNEIARTFHLHSMISSTNTLYGNRMMNKPDVLPHSVVQPPSNVHVQSEPMGQYDCFGQIINRDNSPWPPPKCEGFRSVFFQKSPGSDPRPSSHDPRSISENLFKQSAEVLHSSMEKLEHLQTRLPSASRILSERVVPSGTYCHVCKTAYGGVRCKSGKVNEKPKVQQNALEVLQKKLHQSDSEELGAEVKNCNKNREPETGIVPGIEELMPVKSTMDAKFLFDETVPDGTKFLADEVFTKRWRMVNFGCKPWDHDTTLKYLWGTKGFTPTFMEVDVPHLLPRQNGSVSVQYRAPTRPGFYESHWSFTHKGHRFGHRIWCSIEVVDSKSSQRPSCYDESRNMAQSQEPENGENQNLSESRLSEDRAVQGDDIEEIAAVTSTDIIPPRSTNQSDGELSDNSEIPDLILEDGSSALIQGVSPPRSPEQLNGAHSVDPKNPDKNPDWLSKNDYSVYDRVFSPPKFPEHSDSELSDDLCEIPDLESENGTCLTSRESELGSVINLSSSSSDSEFVVVPMPSCFDVPFVVSCDSDSEQHTPTIYTENKGKNLSAASSVIFLSPEGKEIPVKDLKLFDGEAETKHDHLYCMKNISRKYYALLEKRVGSTNKVEQLRPSSETGEASPVDNLLFRDRGNGQGQAASNAYFLSPCYPENNHVTAPDGSKRRDSLASAAASIFDSACSAISALQWVPIPPDDNGDYIDPNLISPYFPLSNNMPSFTHPN